MNPEFLVKNDAPAELLNRLLTEIHAEGPVRQESLEALAYIKKFHPQTMLTNESTLMYLLGLFYKTSTPNDLLSLSYQIYQSTIEEDTRSTLTPVQASITNKIAEHKFFSFSAPTSTGKSHVLRKLIFSTNNDIAIILPSRALISEYLITIRRLIEDRKDILTLQFVENINKAKTSRRIFLLTPERGSELFKSKEQFNIDFLIFDEAQISEEGTRGITFDAFVRRAERNFPDAKKVFVHPFVENPEAQLIKHGFTSQADSHVYRQSAVGKIFAHYDERTGKFSLFSPFIKNPHHKKNQHALGSDLVEDVLKQGGNVLIYVSKQFIYEKRYNENFQKYIGLCQPIDDPEALSIINEVERLLGATKHHSELISLMRLGIIIHHGSIPLVVRYLIESFANLKFARICFATSTLAQGVNMPFDLVWIENLRFYGTDENKNLGLKNLIGRAGRTTAQVNSFDFGYVVASNCKSFTERLLGEDRLSNVSALDDEEKEYDSDLTEFIASVKNQTLNEDYGLPEVRVTRLNSPPLREKLKTILDLLFRDEKIISGDEYQEMSKEQRSSLKSALAAVFESSLGRTLNRGEVGVLSTAIAIFLWQVQGGSFRTLVALRYSYLTQRDKQREIHRRRRKGEITNEERDQMLSELSVRYSPIASQLPAKNLVSANRFNGQKALNINYDLIVYDTYDYVDKVISFSLSETYIAAFDQYFNETGDSRALDLVDFIRFGTVDQTAILLMRYGFSPENLDKIIPHVESISEEQIVFKSSISNVEIDAFDSNLIDHYQ